MAFFSTLAAIGAAVGVGSATVGAAGFTAAALAGGAIAGSALYGVGSLLTGGQGGQSNIPSPQAPKSADSIIAESQAKAQQDQQDLLQQRRRNTVLTGPTGLFDEPNTGKKTLLGG